MAKPLLPLPHFEPLGDSPVLVTALDAIRFGPLDAREEFDEFCWFIREYPRAYRHHLDHAEYRLKLIYEAYEHYHADAARRIGDESDIERLFEWTTSTRTSYPYCAYAIYWNFESYLQAISSALDIATRVIGTAFVVDTAPTFNRFCRTAPNGEFKALFVRAQQNWVLRMKNYRDCFVHYTPVDTFLGITVRQYSSHWQVRAKLPVNPEAREILRFRYRQNRELLEYATRIWRRLVAFDRSLGTMLTHLYRKGQYPKKYRDLFHIGRTYAKVDDGTTRN